VTNIIKYGDFVEVTTDRLNDADLYVGNRLFVAGTKAIPEYEADPYILRMKLLVCKVNDEGHIINDKFLMVDPRNVQKVSKTQQKKLAALMHNDFTKDTQCKGIDLSNGEFSGCDGSGGDCPSCGK
jgi:hypothetical protein